MKLLERIVAIFGVTSLALVGLVPSAQGASGTISCYEYFDETGNIVVGLSCTNVTSLQELPMTEDIQWIGVETKGGQVLGGLEVLADNPQLQGASINKAPQEIIPELAKLPELETLSLFFPAGQQTQLSGLGQLSSLKELKIGAVSSTDYRWAKDLSNLEVLDVSSYTKPLIELNVGQSVEIEPLITVDGKVLTPWEHRVPSSSNERILSKIGATSITAKKAGYTAMTAGLYDPEVAVSGLENLRSVSYESTWRIGVYDTAQIGRMSLSKDPSLPARDVAVVGDALLAPSSNYPYTALQWTRNGKAIPGAVAENYKLVRDDANAVIGLDYETAPVFQASRYWVRSVSGTVTYGVPIASTVATISKPKITGSKIVGEKLTASIDATYFPEFERRYQWFVDGFVISGANAKTYVPPASYANRKISVQVSFHASEDDSVYLPESTAVKVVKGSITVAKPTVSGTARVGSKLSVKAATPAPAVQSVSYQWLRSGTKIKGATAKTYTLSPADLNQRITVSVKYAKANYTTKTVVSTSIGKIAPAKLKLVKKPVITGKKATGKTLKATAGTYNAKNVKISYQWVRSGKIINKATKSSYKVVKADAGKTLQLWVTASKPGFTTVVTKISKK